MPTEFSSLGKAKLIEVALPLDAINKASVREKSLRHGHPSTLHLWWARRPLAAARAVLFAQMVDDPSSNPSLFPTKEGQEVERQRLFQVIMDLVQWDNTTNEIVLAKAREEIWKCWRATCAENATHPQAKELFNPGELPGFSDPFAGGGALPLEAQRLGLKSYASDLNPVAVLINKAMIEIPPKFAGKPPVNPQARTEKVLVAKMWRGAHGLAEDVRHYGLWMRDQAEASIGQLYPRIEVTATMAKDRPDLKNVVGNRLTVIAWLWARTVKSPNPAFATVEVPLVSNFMLSTKPGQEAYIDPIVEGDHYRFTVRIGKPADEVAAKTGTKLARGAHFRCLMSGTPITGEYIKAQGKAGRMGARLLAIVAEGERGRFYLPPTEHHEEIAHSAKPTWKPEVVISGSTQYLGVKPYGMEQFSHLFTDRQLLALTTFADLARAACGQAYRDAISAGLADDGIGLNAGGTGARAYSEAVSTYLAFSVSRLADRHSSLCRWDPNPTGYAPKISNTFGRQALPMVWDYVEGNPFSQSSGNFGDAIGWITDVLRTAIPAAGVGFSVQADARTQLLSQSKVVSTDPPYYDNVPYADLSDFFFIWLRRCLKPVFPELFATVAVPKTEELVAFAYRHENKEVARAFFLDGMTQAMRRLAEEAHPAFPVTIYYAFKQAETDGLEGTASTGWETFLGAVIHAGFVICGTWPMRTELANRMRSTESNALASSIILVCRPRSRGALIATRREFVAELNRSLPLAIAHLQGSNIAPVDLAQAAIGPGMSVYTHYARVIEADGSQVSVRDALSLINQTVDEVLSSQEGDFDADTRWALAWFDLCGFAEGEYGVANGLATAKNTSVGGLAKAGLLVSKGGKVRLFLPAELPAHWNPTTDSRPSVWKVLHYLICVFESRGESGAAELLAKLGTRAEIARELAYRLYTVCERKRRAKDALSYNGLVQSWPEVSRLARESRTAQAVQTGMFEQV